MTNDEKLEINFERWWNAEIASTEGDMSEPLLIAVKGITKTAWSNGAYIQSILMEDEEIVGSCVTTGGTIKQNKEEEEECK